MQLMMFDIVVVRWPFFVVHLWTWFYTRCCVDACSIHYQLPSEVCLPFSLPLLCILLLLMLGAISIIVFHCSYLSVLVQCNAIICYFLIAVWNAKGQPASLLEGQDVTCVSYHLLGFGTAAAHYKFWCGSKSVNMHGGMSCQLLFFTKEGRVTDPDGYLHVCMYYVINNT